MSIFLFSTCIFLCSCDETFVPYYQEAPALVEGTTESPNGAGVLKVESGVRVLKLKGTQYEMGYAHGYLLAEEILYMVDNYTLYITNYLNEPYFELREKMSYFDWDMSYGHELEGMLAGILAKLGEDGCIIHPKDIERNLDLVDLQIVNTISDWACSSFSAWGASRTDGSVIYARNLDYHKGYDEAFKRTHVLISYKNEDATAWAGASVAGFIGCISGMSEHGMTLALHNTDKFESTNAGDYIPRCMILRQLMENSQNSWVPNDVDALMDQFPAYEGMNLHITFPCEGRDDNEIAGVIEFDGNADHADGRGTLRNIDDNPALPGTLGKSQAYSSTHTLINTNHYLKRKPEDKDFEDNSIWRYYSIRDGIKNAETDGNIDINEALSIMKDVGHVGTVHTVVFEADQKLMHFYLATPVVGGFDSPGVSYTIDELF